MGKVSEERKEREERGWSEEGEEKEREKGRKREEGELYLEHAIKILTTLRKNSVFNGI